MGKVIKFVVSLLVVIFIAAFYALLNIDLNDYKQQIEDATSDATGRQLQLEGDVSIAWSLIPTLVVEKATFSNASWGSEPEMVALDKFEVRLALYPLLQRHIQVTKVLLHNPHILVETNKKGMGNWVFDVESMPEPEVLEQDEASAIQSVIVNELDITQAKIDYIDGMTGEKKQFLVEHLSIDIADLDTPIDVLLKAVVDNIPVALDGQVGGTRALMNNEKSQIALKLNAGGIDVSLDGDIAKPHEGKGAVIALSLNTTDAALSSLSGSELPRFGSMAVKGDIQTASASDMLLMDLSGNIDGLDLLLKGDIAKPLEMKGASFDIDLKTNSATLSLLAGTEIPDFGDVNVKGKVSNELKSETLQLDLAALIEGLELLVKGHILEPAQGNGIKLDLDLASNATTLSLLAGSELPPVGDVLLSGALSGGETGYQFNDLNLTAGKTDLTGDIAVSLVDSKPVIKATLMSNKIDLAVLEQGEASVETKPTSDRIFSDEPLIFDALKQIDADITIQVKALETASVNLNQIDVGINLQEGNLNVSPIKADFAGSRLDGRLGLDARSDVARLDTVMQVNGFKLQGIKALKETISGGNTDVYFRAKANGTTVRKMMAGLDGKAIVKVGESNIADGTLDLLGADFIGELVGMLNPFSKEQKGTQLACAVVNFDIKDGIATAKKGIAVQTGKLNIVGNGTIDLKTEKIKIGIKPEARTGIGVNISQLAGLVKVGGTLAKPAAQVDEAAVLAAGVSGAAAVATGGLSVVAQGLANRGTADKNPCKTALGVEE